MMPAGVDDGRVQIVRFFGRYDCLIDPELVDYLSKRDDVEEHAKNVLTKIGEVPFYLTFAAFREAEARLASPTPENTDPGAFTSSGSPDSGAVSAGAVDAEAEQARKAALSRMLEMVYDQKAMRTATDDDGDEDAEAGPSSRVRGALLERPKVRVNRPSSWRPVAAEYSSEIKILKDITGNSTCEGTTDDFAKYFRSRFHQLERLLRKRRELANAVTIDRALEGPAQEVATIGLVTESRTTGNGHRLMELEDETGKVAALVVNNERTDKQLMAQALVLVPDEVVGIIAQKTSKGDLLIVRDIIRPDVPFNEHRQRAEDPLAVAVLSDVHVGNELFLEDNFVRMLKWLNGEVGNSREREMAGRIKYLMCPGDMVDGVGIYPGQEHNLAIQDIYDQYGYFGGLLEAVPDHIQVILQPGNHDAARPIEPQPALDKEVREKFDPVEATYIGNPSLYTLHGVRVLSYHGCSLMDYATAVQGLEHHDPLPIMEQMMKCRHLAPIYGQSTPLAPEHTDYMVIDTVPELFVTGHVHTFESRNYRGVAMVNSSTWQSQTDYQRMLNMQPDPAILPIFDLKSLKSTAMNFQMGMDFDYKGKALKR